MDEFSLIDLITDTLGARKGAIGGVGDDAAILEVPENQQLVISTDTLVEGVHFDPGAKPADIGYKALAVNLSDLAAMGARPGWFFLALTHPALDQNWVHDFAAGLNDAAGFAGIALAGGDTTRGPLSITITACGLIDRGQAMLRSGAQPGDLIGLSGVTGLAGLALQDRLERREPAAACQVALDRPVPRLQLGQALVGFANSCIDVSDGLLADLSHVAQASRVGMKISLEDLPGTTELEQLVEEKRWNLQLGGGDDYELCFTAPPENWESISHSARKIGLRVTQIGKVIAGTGVTCLRPDGKTFAPRRSGYNHGVQRDS